MTDEPSSLPPPEPDPSQDRDALGPEFARQPDAAPPPAAPAAHPFPGSLGPRNQADAHSEEVLWVGRTSWRHFAGLIALWSLGSILLAGLVGWLAAKWDALGGAAAFWIVLVLIVILGAFVAARVVRGVLGQRYRLTSERLFIERGLLGRTIDQTELIRVDDVRIHKSFANMILGVGTVEILSTDVSDRKIQIEGINQSEQVAEAIRNCVRSLRRQSLFVESL